MENTNLLVFAADIHWSEEKFDQINYSFKNFVDYIKNNKPKFVVLGGDYFEKRIIPDSKVYKKALGYLLEISKFTKNLIVIKGTHSHDANQLEILNEFKFISNNIYYFDKFTIKEIDGYKFAFIPEEYPENYKEYYKDLYQNKYDFIIGHGMLNGAKMHNGIVNKYIKDLQFNYKELDKLCKYNLWGHIHLPQKLSDKTFYNGSLGRWKFGEEEAKRFLVVDQNFNIKSIEIPSYQYLTFNYKEYLTIKENIKTLLKDKTIFIRIIADKDIKELEDLNREFPQKLKILDKNKKLDIKLENQIKYQEIIDKNINEQYLYIINEELKNKKFTKKEKEWLKKENLLILLKELEENTFNK